MSPHETVTLDLPPGDILRILVVDDDHEDYEIAANILEEAPESREWCLEWAPDAERALDMMRLGQHHIVLVDYSLGARSGVEVIRELKALSPTVPFVLLTGHEGREADQEARQAGAAGFLHKGEIGGGMLERTIRYAVDSAREKVELARMVRRDPLTGLHNRLSLSERLTHAMARAERRPERLLAVLAIDLDGFKGVNDRFGHQVGDKLLVEVARRIKAELRPYDTVARLGGDEMVVLLEDLEGLFEARSIAERLVASIAAPFDFPTDGAEAPRVTASIGGVIHPGAVEGMAGLLARADEALYDAKRAGKNRVVVWTAPTRRLGTEGRMPRSVSEAIGSGTLDLWLQPQVSLETGDLTGLEVLSRWKDVDGRPTSTVTLISNLERSGAIVDWDVWVLEQALQLLGGLPRTRLAVNVSPASLTSGRFFERVSPLTEGAQVELELTERGLADDSAHLSRRIERLREMGYTIALDDFGVGFSSLARFARTRFDTLKIDRCFVEDLDTLGRSESVIRALVLLAGCEGLSLVAEGVETARQGERLREIGVTNAQGFHFARPMPQADLVPWLEKRARGVRTG